MPFPEESPCLLVEITGISMGPGGVFDDEFEAPVFVGGGGGVGLCLAGIEGGTGGAGKEMGDGVDGEIGGGGVDG